MKFPRSIYHKDYKTADDEKTRENRTRVAKTEAELKELGPDWGVDHPEHKKSWFGEAKAHVEPKKEEKPEHKPDMKKEEKPKEKAEPKEAMNLKVMKAKDE